MSGGIYDFDYIRRCVGYADTTLSVVLLCSDDYQPSDPVLELIEYVQPRGDPAETATNRPGNTHPCFVVSEHRYGGETFAGRRCILQIPTANQVTWSINKGAKSISFNGPDDIALELIEPVPAAVKKGA